LNVCTFPTLSLTVTVVLLGACARPPSVETPVSAYKQFAEALRRGDDPKLIWNLLSTSTQEMLKARSKEISAASEGMIRDEPVLMLVQTGVKPLPIGEIKLIDEQPTSARLEVMGQNGPEQLTMLREADRWRVDLSEVLKK
jgi:hypothetical protein